MALETFRWCVREVTTPKPYVPVITEAKGVCGVVFGVAYLVAGQGMKLSSDLRYQKELSARHITLGVNALKVGLKDILPGAVVVVVLSSALRAYPIRFDDIHK